MLLVLCYLVFGGGGGGESLNNLVRSRHHFLYCKGGWGKGGEATGDILINTSQCLIL